MKNQLDIYKYKISETYIKFNFEYSEINKLKIKEAILSQIKLTSIESLKDKEYRISIEFEKGSIKTRISVWATALYIGIGQYGSFRSGIRDIISDTRLFSEEVISKIDSNANISQNDIIRTEKRSGLLGRIKEIYRRIDAYENNINNLSNSQQQTELNSIKTEIASLIALLSNDDRQIFLNDLDSIYHQNLPQPDQRRINHLINRYAIRPEENIEFIDE